VFSKSGAVPLAPDEILSKLGILARLLLGAGLALIRLSRDCSLILISDVMVVAFNFVLVPDDSVEKELQLAAETENQIQPCFDI